VAALVLLAVTLLIPQLTWADHASDHPYSQFDDPSIVSSASVAHDALVEKYKEDRSFSASADSARWASQGKYYMEESERAAVADSARWVALGEYHTNDTGRNAAFLAANPEVMASQRYATAQQEPAVVASSARWVALGKYYMEKAERAAAADSARWAAQGSRYAAKDQTDAAFLAANPEIMTYQRYAGQQNCSDLGLQC
jgi:hypothetical protein